MELLEQIKEQYRIPNAYQEWSEYREKLTERLLWEVDGPRSSILILGAGASNDIDLEKLARSGVKMTLMDWDKEAMEEALAKYAVDAKIETVSFNGILEKDLEQFIDSLLRKLRTISAGKSTGGRRTPIDQEFARYSVDLMKQLFHTGKNKVSYEKIWKRQEYDFILASGLTSQINAFPLYIWNTIWENAVEQIFKAEADYDENRIEKEAGEVEDVIKKINNREIPRFTEEVMKAAAKKAFFCSEYDEEYPVEGAWQCIESVRTMVKEQKLAFSESFLTWDFNLGEGRHFPMIFQGVESWKIV